MPTKTQAGDPSILVVDDDPQISDLYRDFLMDGYRVHTANSGPEALELFGETDIDAVLLDRRMPEMSGDEVCRALRDRDYEGPIAMITAVKPDFDIIELGFDDYLLKPVEKNEVIDQVESLLRRREYDDTVREYFALVSTITALEAEKTREELESNPEYTELTDRLAAIKQEARHALMDAMEAKEFAELLEDIQEEVG